jgi:hypothetical protein
MGIPMSDTDGGSGLKRALRLGNLVEIAFAVHLQDLHAVRQAVQESRWEVGVSLGR